MAQQRLAALKKNNAKVFSADESLFDFIPRVFEGFAKPTHYDALNPYLSKFATDAAYYLTVTAPPRHGKSFTCAFALIAYSLARDPSLRILYSCYSATLAEGRNRSDIIPTCKKAGIEFATNNPGASSWLTKQGGGVWARGVEGAIVGLGFDIIIIDDPFMNREEAESPVMRQKVLDWFSGVALNRLEPDGSIVVTHTRWHPDDLIGTIRADDSTGLWKHFDFPAISEDGQALWPARYNLEKLQRMRDAGTTDYDWWSLFMCQPRPKGQGVFNDFYYYDELPKIVKYSVGIDLAYTAKTYSDWSAAILLGKGEDGNYYVVDVLRRKCKASDYVVCLKQFLAQHKWPPCFSYIGGVEKGVTDFFTTQGVKIRAEPAKADKFVRAQPVATAWAAKKVLLPRRHVVWKKEFENELSLFTGLGDKHDDQVDALAGAFTQLTIPPPARGVGQTRLMPF